MHILRTQYPGSQNIFTGQPLPHPEIDPRQEATLRAQANREETCRVPNNGQPGIDRRNYRARRNGGAA